MKEISLNILDVAENSVKAGAALTQILLQEENNMLRLTIADDGCGMTPEILRGVTDPFYTTRTTRKVGLGLPLLQLACEQTGGSMSITSISETADPENHGTKVEATFFTDHIDCTPLGDVVSSIVTLIQGHPNTDFYFSHRKGEGAVELDTRELRQVLEDVPLDSYEVIKWIESFLRQQYEEL